LVIDLDVVVVVYLHIADNLIVGWHINGEVVEHVNWNNIEVVHVIVHFVGDVVWDIVPDVVSIVYDHWLIVVNEIIVFILHVDWSVHRVIHSIVHLDHLWNIVGVVDWDVGVESVCHWYVVEIIHWNVLILIHNVVEVVGVEDILAIVLVDLVVVWDDVI